MWSDGMVSSTSEICVLISKQLKYPLQQEEEEKRGRKSDFAHPKGLSQFATHKWSHLWMNDGGICGGGPWVSESFRTTAVLLSSAEMPLLTASAWHLHARGLFLRKQRWWLHYLWDHLSTSLKSGQHQLPRWRANSSLPHM